MDIKLYEPFREKYKTNTNKYIFEKIVLLF